MVRFIAFAAFVLIVSSTGCKDEQGTDAGIQRILDEVLEAQGLDSSLVWIHEYPDVLQPGDVVQTLGPDDASEDIPTTTIERPSRLYWVDLFPFHGFTHETMFVYIDEATGDLSVEDHSWYPVVNGDEFWPEDPTYGDPEPPPPQAAGLVRPFLPPRAAANADRELNECQGQLKRAIVIQGLDRPYTKGLYEGMGKLLEGLYDVHSISIADYQTAAAFQTKVFNSIRELGDSKLAVDELLIYYIGHGDEFGRLVLHKGDDQSTDRAYIDNFSLGKLIDPVRTDEVTFVLESCHSGRFGETIEEAWNDLVIEGKHVHVWAAAAADEKSWLPDNEWVFTNTLGFEVGLLAPDPQSRLPWETFDVPAFDVETTKGTVRQTPQLNVINTPVLDQKPGPQYDTLIQPSNECLVVGLDTQQYDRRVNLRGHGFGSDKGRVLMMTPTGDWQPVNVTYWSNEAITIYAPMRSDGFPSTKVSGDHVPLTFAGLQEKGGHYAVRVERADGKHSTEQLDQYLMAHLPLQVYWNDFVGDGWGDPPMPPGYFWSEAWHHYTKEDAAITGGPTVQSANLSVAGEYPQPPPNNKTFPDPYQEFDYDQNQPFSISPNAQTSMNAGFWSWDLAPGEYDANTSFLPDAYTTNYFGFRMRFEDEQTFLTKFRYELVYD